MNPRPQSSEYREDWGCVCLCVRAWLFFPEKFVTTNQTTEYQNMVLLVIGFVIFLCYENNEAGLRDVMGCHIWGSEFRKERVLDRKVPRANFLGV